MRTDINSAAAVRTEVREGLKRRANEGDPIAALFLLQSFNNEISRDQIREAYKKLPSHVSFNTRTSSTR